jgi:putative endonuclease
MAYYCYIAECADGSLYTGITTDPQRRIRQHNAGTGAMYTKLHRPVKLVFLEEQPDQSSALVREFQIKRLPRLKKLELINTGVSHSPA